MTPFDLRQAFASVPAGMAAYESPLMNVCEAADYLGKSINFVRRVVRYEVPVVQHGKRGPLLFFKTDLDRWLASLTRVPVK